MSRPPSEQPEDLTTLIDAVAMTGPAVSGAIAADGPSGAPAIGLITRPDGELSIPITSALSNLIDGYLLGDLELLATEISATVGYPMVMSVLSGSELLGTLTSDVSQTNRIEEYWSTYMAKVDPRYGYLGKIASELARNGIAHSYLSHLGVLVERGRGRHLMLYGAEVIFDCVELYADFRRSYEGHARPHILANRDRAQSKLDALVRHDLVKAKALLSQLPTEFFHNILGSGAHI